MIDLPERPAGATRVVLLRHAETAETAAGVVYGDSDVDLSSAGVAQAQQLAATVAALGPAVVYSSPRRRAARTASAVAAVSGLSVTACEDLRELSFGAFEGRRYDDLREEWPELYRKWMEHPTEVRFPGGESFSDLRARSVRALDTILARHPEVTSVLVTHGGVTRALLGQVLGLADQDVFRLDQAYGALNVVDFFGATPLIRVVNARCR